MRTICESSFNENQHSIWKPKTLLFRVWDYRKIGRAVKRKLHFTAVNDDNCLLQRLLAKAV